MNRTRVLSCLMLASGLLVIGARGAQHPTPLVTDANTRFLYQFDETGGTTANDTSGAGRHAVYGPHVTLGHPTVFETGKSMRSQESFGLNSATCWQAPAGSGTTSILSTDIHQKDFTVQMWVRWDGNPMANQRKTLFAIQPIGSTTVDVKFGVLESSNPWNPNALFIESADTIRAFVGGGTAWQVGAWYHVALVVDYLGGDTNYKIYWTPKGATVPRLVLDYTQAGGITLSSSTNDRQLTIGQEFGDSGRRYWPGEIDGFKFSNKALSEDEMSETLIPEQAPSLLLFGHTPPPRPDVKAAPRPKPELN